MLEIVQIADLVLSMFCLFGARSPIWPYHRPWAYLDRGFQIWDHRGPLFTGHATWQNFRPKIAYRWRYSSAGCGNIAQVADVIIVQTKMAKK